MKDYKRIEHMRNLNDSLIWERMKRCYDFGYEDGKADTPFTDTKEAENKAYNRGLNDAWEVIKKITKDDSVGGYSIEMMQELFGRTCVYDITHNYTPEEAIAKIREYEDKRKQDAEIKVGDEIRLHDAIEVVTSVMSTGLQTIDASGNTSTWYYNTYPLETWEKTGRTFPQIAEVLAEMRGAENDT